MYLSRYLHRHFVTTQNDALRHSVTLIHTHLKLITEPLYPQGQRKVSGRKPTHSGGEGPITIEWHSTVVRSDRYINEIYRFVTTVHQYNYYPSSCLLFKTQHLRDRILVPNLGGIYWYVFGERDYLYFTQLSRFIWSLRNVVFLNKRQNGGYCKELWQSY
jgi:hypothetical protein